MDDEEYMTVFHVDLFKRKCCDGNPSVDHFVYSLDHGEFFNNDFTFVSQVHWDYFLSSLSVGVIIEFDVIKQNGFLNCT